MIDKLTFVVAVNDRNVYARNFLASPLFRAIDGRQIIVQKNFVSASKAYNDAIDKSLNDLIVFCHQDILLPHYWLKQVEYALDHLRTADPKWGVLGCYGKEEDGREWGHVYSSGRGVLGMPFATPKRVQTLDEIVLILRKSSGLRFDEELPYFHLYGADICLRAAQRAMRNYAICAFCIHNTRQTLILPTEFYRCCSFMRKRWSGSLPIRTPTITLTSHNVPIRKRRMKEFLLRIRGKATGGKRLPDPTSLLQRFATIPAECSTDEGLSLASKINWHVRKNANT